MLHSPYNRCIIIVLYSDNGNVRSEKFSLFVVLFEKITLFMLYIMLQLKAHVMLIHLLLCITDHIIVMVSQ